MGSPRRARRLMKTFATVLGSVSLLTIWTLATTTALMLAALISRAGGSESGAAAVFGPPLGLVYALAFRALLRRALERHEAAETLARARAEGEELLRDPEFLESLNQLARGQGTIVRARTRDEEENPNG